MKQNRRRSKAANPANAIMNWAERIAQDAKRNARRYEHLIHALYCGGQYDHLLSRKEVVKRKANCAKICGLCRYINSLDVWPQPNYRRPSDDFLKALEENE